jgi:hypothetical protein
MKGIKKTEEVQQGNEDKKHFEDPKLAFIQPKLTKHGDATKITTNGLFGEFSPTFPE